RASATSLRRCGNPAALERTDGCAVAPPVARLAGCDTSGPRCSSSSRLSRSTCCCRACSRCSARGGRCRTSTGGSRSSSSASKARATSAYGSSTGSRCERRRGFRSPPLSWAAMPWDGSCPAGVRRRPPSPPGCCAGPGSTPARPWRRSARRPDFNYLALLAALRAVGAAPRPSLVLLAYAAAKLLGLIPLTPGGLGFVEAGLVGTLTLAGVSGPGAVAATLLYRLVAFWLPIPAGGVAYVLFRRRYDRRKPRCGVSARAPDAP